MCTTEGASVQCEVYTYHNLLHCRSLSHSFSPLQPGFAQQQDHLHLTFWLSHNLLHCRTLPHSLLLRLQAGCAHQ
jgi:hypothetical protein